MSYIFCVAATSGLANAGGAHRDPSAMLGASRLSTALRLDLPPALLAVASAMKL